MRVYGLIGYPLAHSFSKRYFTAKFSKEKITDAIFHLYEIPDIQDLKKLLDEEKELCGFSVTIPYKEKVIPFLDEIDRDAKIVGAVNSVKVIRKEDHVFLKGYNTDIVGFEQTLAPALKPYHEKALILGTGGAAKAVAYVLSQKGIMYQYVSRKPNAGQLSYNDLDAEMMKEHTLIVNSTPLGTSPNVEHCPDIPYELLGAKHLLFDLLYNPPMSKFLRLGKNQDAEILNGMGMLEIQADESWRIWNS